MALIRIKTFLLLSLLLFPLLSDPGMVEGFMDDMHPKYSLYKDDGIQMKKMRKILMVDAVLDYDDAGANTKHDPPKKKPNGGKQP